jgi:nuclear factor erythroid 2-related factor 1/3
MKKDLTDGLLQLAIVLSLFRTDLNNLHNYLNSYGHYPEIQEIILGSSSAYIQTHIHTTNWDNGIGFSHPKNIDSYYSSSVFRELHSLAHYNSYQSATTDLNAWLVSGPAPALQGETSQNTQEAPHEQSEETIQPTISENVPSNNGHAEDPEPQPEGAFGLASPDLPCPANTFFEGEPSCLSTGSDLTKEDVDLIEILWRQDMDLGISRDMFDQNLRKEREKKEELELQKKEEKEKELESLQTVVQTQLPEDQTPETITYIIDGETGELVAAPPDISAETAAQQTPSQEDLTPQLDDNEGLSIEEAMRLLEEQGASQLLTNESQALTQPEDLNLTSSQLEQEIEAMIQNAEQFSQQQQQTQLCFDRQDSFESRWEDVAHLLNLPDSNDTGIPNMNQNGTVPVPNQPLIHNVTLMPQMDNNNISFNQNIDVNPAISPSVNMSMPFHNTTMGNDGNSSFFDLDTNDFLFRNVSDAVVPQNDTFGPAQTETLLQELMNDKLDNMEFEDVPVSENLQLARNVMDDASSDSAVSSMGSASPSQQDLSDIGPSYPDTSFHYDGLVGATGGSDFGETKFTQPKEETFGDSYGDFSYGGGDNMHMNSSGEESSGEGSCGSAGDPRQVRHNHTYPLQPGQTPRESKKAQEEARRERLATSRDEKRVKSLKIPFTTDEIIHSPVEQFNEMLTKYQLSEPQLQLIRDIRRRGKNKVAAQNCRKRKLEVINHLEDEVHQLQVEKERLMKERRTIDKEASNMRDQLGVLYREVFASLRDDNGHPYNPNEYSLQHTEDGNVFLVPVNSTVKQEPETHGQKKRKGSKKGN